MSDANPYEPPCELGDSPVPAADSVWPKTATAVIDEDVYVRAFRIHLRRAHRIRRLTAAITMFAGVSVLLYWPLGPRAIGIGAIAAVSLWLLSGFTSPVSPRSIRKQLREMRKDHEEIRLEVTPDAIRMVTDESDSRIPWNRFLKWKEEDGLILAYRTSLYFRILPIEQFPTDVQDAIRECLRTHVASHRTAP
jgi:hypothetical protein